MERNRVARADIQGVTNIGYLVIDGQHGDLSNGLERVAFQKNPGIVIAIAEILYGQFDVIGFTWTYFTSRGEHGGHTIVLHGTTAVVVAEIGAIQTRTSGGSQSSGLPVVDGVD